jgi:hypothetical protein
MSELAGSVRQLGTHRNVVSHPERRERGTGLELDAIVVPASRPAQNLEHAISLAQAMQCMLLILCSGYAAPAEVRRLLGQRSFTDAIVVSLPDGYRHDLLDFRALASIKQDLPEACSYRGTDLSTKRNVGLILARMLGWQRIFFLDDDITDIDPADVLSTVSMLEAFPAVGMRVTDYPDNSVVCHAIGRSAAFRGSSSPGRPWPWTASRIPDSSPTSTTRTGYSSMTPHRLGGWASHSTR